MSYYKSMGPSAESSVSDQRHRFSQSGTNDGRSGLEHLGHSGSAPWSYIADHHYISGFHFSAADARDQFKLAIEYPGRSFKFFSFFSCDLGHTSTFCNISIKDLQMTGLLDRFFYWVNDLLAVEINFFYCFQVLSNCFSRNCQAFSVKQAFS